MSKVNNYVSPIKLLYDNIIDSFYYNNEITKSRLDALAEQGLIRRGIYFNPYPIPLRTPKVNLLTLEIEVHEPYMSFLWCIIYNFIFLNEASQKLTSENEKILKINSNTTEGFDEVNNLLGWAFSLKKQYSAWPQFAPNPAIRTGKCLMASVLLVEILKYLLYHEIAHLANNHVNYLSLINTPAYDLSTDQLDELKALEVEADNYAFELLVGGDELDESNYNKALACIVAQLSNLLVIKDIHDLKQLKHPDIDTRLFNLMNKIKFEDSRYQMNIDQTLNVGLSLFLNVNGIEFLPSDPDKIDWHETFEEVLRYLYNIIEKVKKSL